MASLFRRHISSPASANRVFFDTEFIEDGRTIELLSIGMVKESGEEYYAEVLETDRSRASEWVKQNVLPHLTGTPRPREIIAAEVLLFAGVWPEWWAYYADYDWVALCQLFGRMVDLPATWPMFCLDVKQLAVSRGLESLKQPKANAHNALVDARWTRRAWKMMQ